MKKRRKPPPKRNEYQAPRKKRKKDSVNAVNCETATDEQTHTTALNDGDNTDKDASNNDQSEENKNELNLQISLCELNLPQGWSITINKTNCDSSDRSVELLKTAHSNNKEKFVERSILINKSQVVYRDFTEKELDLSPKKLSSTAELNSAVQSFDKVKICLGVRERELFVFERCASATKHHNCWRSNNCLQVIKKEETVADFLCTNCVFLRSYLKKRLSVITKRKEISRTSNTNFRRVVTQRAKRCDIRIQVILTAIIFEILNIYFPFFRN